MNKERENNHLKHFKSIFKNFPDGEIECQERPDFIVHSKTKIIGIELTEIFNRKRTPEFHFKNKIL